MEVDDPVSIFQHLPDGGSQPAVAKGDLGALPQTLARVNDALPSAFPQIPQQQDFYSTPRAGLLAIEPGGDHFRVVDDEAVPRGQIFPDLIKMAVGHLAGLPVQHHQAGGIPFFQRGLGNQFFG